MNEILSANFWGDSIGILLNNNETITTSLLGIVAGITNHLLSDVLTYNLLIILVRIITITGSYYIVKKITKIKKFAIIGAILIGLSPLHTRYLMEWPNHANWAWILLYFFFFMKLMQNPVKKQLRNSFLAGLFFSVALIENTYHGVELAFLSLPIFAYFILSSVKKSHKREMKALIINFLILGFLYLMSIGYIYISYSREVNIGVGRSAAVLSSTVRSPTDRWAFSARPWHYLIPDIDHPILGNLAVRAHYFIWQNPPYYLTEPFFPKEHTLFLGYTLLALSAYTLFQTYFKKRITGDKRFAVTFFLIIAATGFIFSMPPYMAINNFKIYFPSHFIYDFLPQFRAYARYGVMVFIGNTIIALIGLEYLISNSFKNYSRKKTLQNLLLIGIMALAIFEFLPGYHSISTKPTLPYEWLSEQAKLKKDPLKYMEIPERADHTDHLYTSGSNIEIINPYLATSGNARLLEDIIWQRENPLIPEGQIEKNGLFCEIFQKLSVQYIFYHKKDVNKQKVADEFKETQLVTPQLKTAMSESWGYPIWRNHVPKSNEDIKKDRIRLDMENILINDDKLEVVKIYTNAEIVASRPNKNFSADKFDAVTIYRLNENYCNRLIGI